MNDPADALTLRPGIEVEEKDFARTLKDRNACQAIVGLSHDAEVVSVGDPGQEILWRLVGQPGGEGALVIVMIGHA